MTVWYTHRMTVWYTHRIHPTGFGHSCGFCNIAIYLSFAMRFSEDGHMTIRNMWQVCGVHRILSQTFVYFLILVS
jgi:hypothetical protein